MKKVLLVGIVAVVGVFAACSDNDGTITSCDEDANGMIYGYVYYYSNPCNEASVWWLCSTCGMINIGGDVTNSAGRYDIWGTDWFCSHAGHNLEGYASWEGKYGYHPIYPYSGNPTRADFGIL